MTQDLIARLREGRTNGTELRWQVTDIHLEAANVLEQQARALEVARKALERISKADDLAGAWAEYALQDMENPA